MVRAAPLAALAVFALACAGTPKVTTIKMQVYADIMCACKTPACADATLNSYEAWLDKDKQAKGSIPVGEHIRLVDCAKKAKATTKPKKPLKPPTPPLVPPSKSGKHALLAMMEKFTKQVCACMDKACADKAYKAMTTWAKLKRPQLRDLVGDSKAQTLQTRYRTCFMRHQPAQPVIPPKRPAPPPPPPTTRPGTPDPTL